MKPTEKAAGNTGGNVPGNARAESADTLWLIGRRTAPTTDYIPELNVLPSPDAYGEETAASRAHGSDPLAPTPEGGLSETTTVLLEEQRAPEARAWREPVVGLTLKGRYRLDERIGSGGMGIVFRATDLEAVRLGRTRCEVAIKVLRIDLKDLEAALFDEVEKTRRMQQENIVDVYGFEADKASSFMVMELLNGIPLNEFVTRSWPVGMPVRLAMPYIKRMGAALAYAHRQGLVHSDFKPSNVMILADNVKVLDFGIARVARAAEELLGITPEFASCEMLELRPADKRDDVFCFGLVVYFLLSGKHPFNAISALDARASKLTVPPIRGLSRRQNAALQQALCFEQSGRASSIEDLVKQLEDPPRNGEAIVSVTLGAAAVAAGVFVWMTPQPHDSEQQFISDLCKNAPVAATAAEHVDEQLVATLLQQGNDYLTLGQSPFDPGVLSENVSSALGAFQSVLALTPRECDVAAQGVMEVATAYKNEATRLYAAGEYSKAAQMARFGLRIWPSSEEMQSLLQKTLRHLPAQPGS